MRAPLIRPQKQIRNASINRTQTPNTDMLPDKRRLTLRIECLLLLVSGLTCQQKSLFIRARKSWLKDRQGGSDQALTPNP